ncbi:MAG: aspartate aminotransferase family protein [Halieaceae bacterium]|nr:aspartate aminotransferase family protein [Halieaceae bacterium]
MNAGTRQGWIRPADEVLRQLANAERRLFRERNPRSEELAAAARENLYGGVPMLWMSDWSTPFPLFVDRAQGARFTDVDGNEYADFCFGDTGSMFGHSPAAIVKAIQSRASDGFTTMLPGPDAVWVGQELARRFGLPYWQVTLSASDANRAVLRWARAVTGRSKVLFFDGCYHGAVDESFVRAVDGHTVHRPGLIGQAEDLTRHSVAVEFNDVPALEQALAAGDIAAVLCEPALTNVGMVLPDPGFHDALRRLTREHGTVLIIDETHTISTGPGGYTSEYGLEPDMLVLGKPIAGGIPAGVYGASADLARRMALVQDRARNEGFHGHSGMGTTLAANAFTMHLIRTTLSQVMTPSAYHDMLGLAQTLGDRLRQCIVNRAAPWSITRMGSRLEFQFCETLPRTGREAESAFDLQLEHFIHLYLLNRGVMITPFHNMMLVSPETGEEEITALVTAFDGALSLLAEAPC